MERKSDILNSHIFWEEVRLLRQQKGKYLCADFCNQLEELSYKITRAIWQYFGFKRIISDQCQNSSKISDNTVDLCMECIEMDLQKIQSFGHLSQMPLDTQVLQILIEGSDDLRTLVAYIKFTISSDNHTVAKRTNNHVENSTPQF